MSIASASALVPTRVDAPSRARVHRRCAGIVVVARASSTQDDDADLSRRGLLSSGEWARMSQAPISSTRHVYPPLVADLPRLSLSLSSYAAAMAAAMAAAIPLDRTAGPFAVPNAFAANEPALPLVPRVSTPLKFSNEVPSRIIKGCWQLSGGHRGDPSSDRTSGPAAVDDFASFVNAGIDTFDTGPEACGYGPSELIIGEALKSGKISRDGESISILFTYGQLE